MLDTEGRVTRSEALCLCNNKRHLARRRETPRYFAETRRAVRRSREGRVGCWTGRRGRRPELVVCRALNRSLDVEAEIAGLAKLLNHASRTTAEQATKQIRSRFETGEGKEHASSLRLSIGSKIRKTFAHCVPKFRKMPKGPAVPDLFLEVVQSAPAWPRASHILKMNSRPG